MVWIPHTKRMCQKLTAQVWLALIWIKKSARSHFAILREFCDDYQIRRNFPTSSPWSLTLFHLLDRSLSHLPAKKSPENVSLYKISWRVNKLIKIRQFLFLNFIPVVNSKFRMNLHQAEGIPSPIHLIQWSFTLKFVKLRCFWEIFIFPVNRLCWDCQTSRINSFQGTFSHSSPCFVDAKERTNVCIYDHSSSNERLTKRTKTYLMKNNFVRKWKLYPETDLLIRDRSFNDRKENISDRRFSGNVTGKAGGARICMFAWAGAATGSGACACAWRNSLQWNRTKSSFLRLTSTIHEA